MAVPWFIWADDKGRFMITFLEHLLHKSHWKQKGGVKLCIPAAFTQSLLELKTCVENGCSCFSWIHCGMHGALWEWGKLFSLGLENTGFQIWIPYLVLHSEPFVLAMGNVKQLRSNRHDQNYDFFVQGQCQQPVIWTCQTRKQKFLPWKIVPQQSPAHLIPDFNTNTSKYTVETPSKFHSASNKQWILENF